VARRVFLQGFERFLGVEEYGSVDVERDVDASAAVIFPPPRYNAVFICCMTSLCARPGIGRIL
jgi:hypothetical protein